MRIKQKSIRNLIILSCIVLVLFLAGCFSKTAVTPPLPEQPTFTHYRVVTQVYKDANPTHAIEVAWRANSIDYSFKIFKSVNGGNFEELFDDGIGQSSYYQRKSCSCSFTDIEVQPGNQYSYYVLAYNEKEEIGQTETFSREIFLPPCTLKEPQDNTEVDTPIPTFSWNNQELTKYLTKSKAEGYLKTHLKVNNETIQEEVWNMTFEDSTVDNVTYNLDSTGEPLVNDNEYEWFHWTDAYDAEGNLIANAYSNSWHFHYKGPIKAVLMGKIMVPETAIPKSRDVGGTIPLVDATITITDSEGNTHTGTTQAQGQYIFPQVAPGTNYIITAVGEVDGHTIIYKDVVPSIALHEVFDAGIADAESTALALVMEAMLDADPNLKPEDIILEDILAAGNFPALVTTVGDTLNAYGNVTTDPDVSAAVNAVDVIGIVSWLDQHAQAWLDSNIDQIVSLIDFPFMIKNYNCDGAGTKTEEEYRSYLEERYEVLLSIETFYYQNNDIHLENQNEAIVYSDKHIKYTGQSGYTFDEINKIYFHLIKIETGWKADEYRVLCTVPMTRVEANFIEVNGNYEIELYWRGYTYQDYEGNWQGADVDKYRIYRSVNDGNFINIPGANYELVPGGNGNEFNFFDNDISLGNDYAYFITADGGDLTGESGQSKIATVIGSKISGFRGTTWVDKFGDELPEYFVKLYWNEFPEATTYHLYRRIGTSGDFSEVYLDPNNLRYDEEDHYYRFYDEEGIVNGTTYQYYIVADLLTDVLTDPSQTITLNTWLSPVNITSPEHNSVITDDNLPLTLNWNLIPILPTNITGGYIDIEIHDETIHDEIWSCRNIDINQTSLTVPINEIEFKQGHQYCCEVMYNAEDENDIIANTICFSQFHYGFPLLDGTSWVETIGDGPSQYYTRGGWIAYPGATSYVLYRRGEDEDDFGIIDIELHFDEEDNEYNFWDNSVSSGITYQYYMVAKDASGGPIYQSGILTIDTWLSPISVVHPENNLVLMESNLPLELEWTSPEPFPANIISGDINIGIYNETSDEDVWEYKTYNLTETSITIPNDEITFKEGNKYYWHVVYDGEDTEDEIANTLCESWFYYGNQPFEFDHAMSFVYKFDDSIEYSVSLQWIGYPDAINYIVYRSIDPLIDFSIVEGELELDDENQVTFNDYNEIDYGVTYYYYVIVDLLGEGTVSSPTITIDTWFPSFNLTYPGHNAIITESNPIFTWDNPGIAFPYPHSADQNGGVHFYVWDATDHIDVWEMQIDLDIRTITYNGELLEEGHEYIWGIRYEGDNTTNGLEVANSCSEGRFYYNATNTVFGVEARTAVSKEQENIEYIIKVRWLPYPDVTNYHIYRRVNETGVFEEIFGEYHVLGYGKYEFVDEDVSNVNTYEYYITAKTSQGETDPSQIFAVDTWFPTFEVTQPAYNSIVMTTNPTFVWEQLPITLSYGSVKYVDLHFHIWDENTGEDIWTIRFDGNNTTTLVYGQEGDVEGPAEPLIKGDKYSWGIVYDGMDENNEIANSWSSSSFYYQEILFDIHADTVSGCNEYYSVELNWNSSDDYNYEIYRSEDGGTNFGFLTDEYEINEGNNCYYRDEDITENMRYDYKVVMLNNSGDEITHAIVTVDTWLPECESFIPAHGALIPVNSLQVFSWTFPPDFEFPYNGKIYFEDSHFWIYDKISGQEVYHTYEDEVWIDSITYDCSGLTSGNEYGWHFEFWGTDSEWNTGAGSAFGGSFFYGSKPFIVNASSITGNSGDHQIEVRWPIYQGASDYRVFRSTNGGSYDMIFDSYGETPDFYDNTIDWWINQGVDFSFCTDGVNINIIDFTVTENNSYSYYVVAYGGSLQDEISSNKTIAINTWLPACWLVAPDDGSTITDSHPLLEWSPPGIETYELPYGQIFEGQMHLQVVNLTDSEEVWDVDFYDLTTSSIIYDGNPLLAEYSYIWRWYPVGLDQNGQFIAEAIGGTRQFTYNGE